LDVLGGLGGWLGNLGELVRRLDEVSEEVGKTGAFEKDGLQGIYGVNVKVGLGRDGSREVKVEPFGNVKRDAATGQTTVSGVREPIVDVLDEGDHLLVVAEMPGIELEDVKVSVEGDILTLEAVRGERQYRREILLPREADGATSTTRLQNGIVEIRLAA
jgi:HSP20 family protein